MDTAGIWVPSKSLLDMGAECSGDTSMEEAGERENLCKDPDSDAG